MAIGLHQGSRPLSGWGHRKSILMKTTNLKQGYSQGLTELMQEYGIFKHFAEDPNQWRTGRLYRTSLHMKYKRT